MDGSTGHDVKVSKRLRWFALALAVFVAVHFTATLVYTVPDVPIDPRIQHRAAMYMKPMFHQGWKLFAPDVPTCNPVLQFRLSRRGEWTSYQKVLREDEVLAHPKLTYTVHKLAVYLMNALRVQCGDTPNREALHQRAFESGSFARCVSFTSRVHADSECDSLQLRLVLAHIPAFKSDALPDSTVFDLPSIAIPHEAH